MLGCKLDREGEGITPKTTVLICFLLLQHNTRSWVLYTERSSLSLCVGRLKVQDPAAPLVRPPEDFWEQAQIWASLPMGSTAAMNWVLRGWRPMGFPFLWEMPLLWEVPGTCSGSWANGCSSLNMVCPSKASLFEDGFSVWQSCWGGGIWRVRPTGR